MSGLSLSMTQIFENIFNKLWGVSHCVLFGNESIINLTRFRKKITQKTAITLKIGGSEVLEGHGVGDLCDVVRESGLQSELKFC